MSGGGIDGSKGLLGVTVDMNNNNKCLFSGTFPNFYCFITIYFRDTVGPMNRGISFLLVSLC